MARPDKWMPMYWADFWKDTTHLSEQEGWAYINLIGAYWSNGGPLPNDDARLQRWSRCSSKVWANVRATVIAFFDCHSDCIKHKRIDRELSTTFAAYEKRRTHMEALNAKRAERAQSLQQSQETVTVDSERNNDSTQSPSQSLSRNLQPQPHSPIGEKITNPPDSLCDHEKFPDFWKAYPSRGTASNPRKPAAKAFARAVKRGADPDELVRLASTAAPVEKHGTEFVPMATTWLNEDRWKDQPKPVAPPQQTDPERAQWLMRCRGFVNSKTQFWNRDLWGPSPNEPGCKAPKDIADETGASAVVPLTRPTLETDFPPLPPHLDRRNVGATT